MQGKMLPPIPQPRVQSPITVKTELPHSQTAMASQPKPFTLPRIELPKPTESMRQENKPASHNHDEDLRRFEEAISSISIDVINNDTPESAEPQQKARADNYYKPSSVGEGYFAEIEHYIKNKNVKEILDDVMNKDFLTSMKDYHDTKAQGKPFYLHSEDLKQKLEKKMNELRQMEEEWHNLKKEAEEKERKTHAIEHEIDAESTDLRALFRQIRINEWLEYEAKKEHYFKLKNGQELKSLNDLRKALTYISDDEFSHHVNAEKNDFANWTQDALQNPELARKIKLAKTKQELQELLNNPIKE